MPDLNIALGDELPIVIVQGSTYRSTLFFSQAGTRVALNGYEGRGQVRKRKKLDSDEWMTFEVTVSQETDVTDPACGRVDVYAGATVTAGMPRSGYYNIELYNPLDPDDVLRVMEGKATLDADVTA